MTTPLAKHYESLEKAQQIALKARKCKNLLLRLLVVRPFGRGSARAKNLLGQRVLMIKSAKRIGEKSNPSIMLKSYFPP
ncbi:MAG: hypothetical protein EOO64_04500 [Massilia sp.]|nr:MAG: hypothetical protein EOO64_04500 [Massilia sp.]